MELPTASSNPNAEVTIYVGAALVIFWYVTSLLGLSDPPVEVGSAATTFVTGLVLLLGNRSRKPKNP